MLTTSSIIFLIHFVRFLFSLIQILVVLLLMTLQNFRPYPSSVSCQRSPFGETFDFPFEADNVVPNLNAFLKSR